MASDQREFENPGQFELDDDFFVTDDEDASIYELTGMYKTDDEAISIELPEEFSEESRISPEPDERRSGPMGEPRKSDRRRTSRGAGKDSSHSIDPMNIYLREMGSLTLLSHEEELRLARMMEEGKRRIQNAAFRTPLAIPALVEVARDLGACKEKICGIVNGVPEDQPDLIASESKAFLACVEKAVELDRVRSDLMKRFQDFAPGSPEHGDLQNRIENLGKEIAGIFHEKIVCSECVNAVAGGLEDLSRRFRKFFVELMSARNLDPATPSDELNSCDIDELVNGQLLGEAGIDHKNLQLALYEIEAGQRHGQICQGGPGQGQSAAGHLGVEEIRQPRSAVFRSHPGREYRTDEGSGEIRLPSGL